MYSALEIPLETRISEDQMLSAEQIAAQKEITEVFIRRAAANEPERCFWERLVDNYQGDIEMLTPDERETFDTLIRKIKEDKPLLAELYDLLKL